MLQAEFATSAVDFLHRIGRTARAGRPGLVTSLYTVSNWDLVTAVCQAEKLGQPVVIFLFTGIAKDLQYFPSVTINSFFSSHFQR